MGNYLIKFSICSLDPFGLPDLKIPILQDIQIKNPVQQINPNFHKAKQN
jgi:hypothetical protein